MKKLKLYKNKIYKENETDLYNSWVEQTVSESEPTLMWKKGSISTSIWSDIKNICEYTNDKFNSECLIRLYYNTKEDKWDALMHPQEMNGMTVNDKLDDDLVLSLGDGWAEAGSVHHHCSSGAFQSGTDHSDEAQTSGLHITIGKVGSDEYEIHSRFREGNQFIQPNLASFFSVPKWLIENVPSKFQYQIFEHLLIQKGNGDLARQDWIDQCKEKPKQVFNQNSVHSRASNGYGYYGQHGFGGYHNSKVSINNINALNKIEDKNIEKEKEEEEEIEWNQNELDAYEIVYNLLKHNKELSIQTILDLIDKPEHIFHYHKDLTWAWKEIREIVKTENIGLHDVRKFIRDNELEIEDMLIEDGLVENDYGTTVYY